MIEVQKADVWTVTLNRPDKANALTFQMLSDIADLAEEAAQDNPAAFILTGAGKVFSAGMDLAAAKAGLATDPVWERLSDTIASLPFPTIASEWVDCWQPWWPKFPNNWIEWNVEFLVEQHIPTKTPNPSWLQRLWHNQFVPQYLVILVIVLVLRLLLLLRLVLSILPPPVATRLVLSTV